MAATLTAVPGGVRKICPANLRQKQILHTHNTDILTDTDVGQPILVEDKKFEEKSEDV